MCKHRDTVLPVGKVRSGHGTAEMCTYTHVVDPLLVHFIPCIILVALQEVPEALLDLPLNAVCPDPVAECTLDVFKRHFHLAHALHAAVDYVLLRV